MDFGRLDDIHNVDFSLPADHASIAKVLKGITANPPEIYTGCPIWADKSWIGTIYPKGAKANDLLMHYSRQFNSIELNATHYKIPDLMTIERWKEVVPLYFKFCPKVPQVISHAKDIYQMADTMIEFVEQVKLLGNNLGTIFLQLPPYNSSQKASSLVKFLEKVPVGTPLSIEFRHPDWFGDNQRFNDICNFMYKHGMGTVITDTAGRRDAIHQRLTNKTVFIRFTANNLHPTDYTRIDEWISRLIRWIAMGAEKLYFCIHTPDKSLNPELVYYFATQMNKAGNYYIPVPKFIHPMHQEKLL